MTGEGLFERIETSLGVSIHEEVRRIAARLAQENAAAAVLFYGSNLRTGSLDGVLDFYVLTDGPPTERIWPRVGYREFESEAGTLRAKIAIMTFDRFARAAGGQSRDTTIWTRFVQPAALAYSASERQRQRVVHALADAVRTATRLAAALGPESGTPDEYWRALFRATYTAEFRVETPGRENSIIEANRAHFDGLLPQGWQADDIAYRKEGDELHPQLSGSRKAQILDWWRARRRIGKPLNILRLAKATTTFEGAARYAAWKLERHTGLKLEVTPFRERHPLLAMPGAAFELWAKRRNRQR